MLVPPFRVPKREGRTPVITPRNYHPTRSRPLRLIVIHTMESGETMQTAENVAAYFAGPNAPLASAHACVDADSVVVCLPPEATAFAAPGCNADGYQIEHAGRAGQGPQGWADEFSQAMLALSAAHARQIADAAGIPLVHLTDEELAAGHAGFIGHDQASRVYQLSDHWDPGPDFPWDQYMALVKGDATTPTTPNITTMEDSMFVIQTTTPWGADAYALITTDLGARALTDQEAQAYAAMIGRHALVHWDHYELLIRQAWERRNTHLSDVGGQVKETVADAVSRVLNATKEA